MVLLFDQFNDNIGITNNNDIIEFFFQTIAKPAPLKATGIKLTKNFASPDCTAKVI